MATFLARLVNQIKHSENVRHDCLTRVHGQISVNGKTDNFDNFDTFHKGSSPGSLDNVTITLYL